MNYVILYNLQKNQYWKTVKALLWMLQTFKKVLRN